MYTTFYNMRSIHLIALYYLIPISVKFALSNNKIDEFHCVVNICQIAALFSSKKENLLIDYFSPSSTPHE